MPVPDKRNLEALPRELLPSLFFSRCTPTFIITCLTGKMAPQTRRAEALASTTARTYHSSPIPQQVHFPARRRIVKTYGRRSASARTLRQQTLTQIDYLKQLEADPDALEDTPSKEERPQKRRKTLGDTPNSSFHTQTLTQFLSDKGDNNSDNGGDELLQIKDSDEESEGGGDDEQLLTIPAESAPKKRAARGRPPKKQRQQENTPKQKTSSHGKRPRAKSPAPPAPPAPQTPSHLKIKVDLNEVPESQPTPFTPMLNRYGPDRSPLKDRSTNVDAPPPTMETISKLPRNLVIQDSYSSGGSPFSSSVHAPSPAKKDTSADRPRREPLAELPIESFELVERSTPRARLLSRDETVSRVETPTKSTGNREIPDSDDELDSVGPSPFITRTVDRSAEDDVTIREDTASESASLPQTGEARADVVSSEESDLEPGTPTPLARRVHIELPPLSTPTPLARKVHIELPSTGLREERKDEEAEQDGEEEEEEEEQVLEEREKETPAALPDVAGSDDLPPGTPTPVVRRVHIDLPPLSSGEQEEEILKETPRKPHKSSPIIQRHTQAKSQRYSQMFDSQRVPLQTIRAMGTPTDRTDIVVAIQPEPAEAIVNGLKDHEFRNYKFPMQVKRCWICTTSPVGEVKYMAVLGPAKEPGQINSNTGVGNEAFNQGTLGYKFAHELVQVYQLNNPVPLEDMKDHGLGEGPPQKYRYLQPAVAAELLGNLRYALFAEGDDEEEEEEEEAERSQDVTVSQELEEQLLSDIAHSTQMAPASSPGPGPGDVTIPASQGLPVAAPTTASKLPITAAARVGDKFARPAMPARFSSRIQSQHQNQNQNQTQPQTQARTQTTQKTPSTTRSLRQKRSGNSNRSVRPSQATTASQASTSSPAISPVAKSSVPRPVLGAGVPRALLLGDGDGDEEEEEEEGEGMSLPSEIARRLELGSSQAVMTMQDSLLVGEVRAPPEIWDSEEEDEGEGDDL
ncbi:hypothetical protein B0T19DRAFT_483441 [Cercophora scortea]|uniref:Uncharacterized protein n=1 Tax=Cercophora scortea TaxID=314031 RepID=A0AAE0MI55_9PEZI|nr:hypothetical protein B0T19DRAFT_483441 [Cercophora scortea]